MQKLISVLFLILNITLTPYVFGDDEVVSNQRRYHISKQEALDLIEELAPKVDLFQDTWSAAPRAVFSENATRAFMYWVFSKFEDPDALSANKKMLQSKARILVSDFMGPSSEVEIVSGNTAVKLNPSHYGVGSIKNIPDHKPQTTFSYLLQQDGLKILSNTLDLVLSGDGPDFEADEEPNKLIQYFFFLVKDHLAAFEKVKFEQINADLVSKISTAFLQITENSDLADILFAQEGLAGLQELFGKEESSFAELMSLFDINFDRIFKLQRALEVAPIEFDLLFQGVKGAESARQVYDSVAIWNFEKFSREQIVALVNTAPTMEILLGHMIFSPLNDTDLKKKMLFLSLWADKAGLLGRFLVKLPEVYGGRFENILPDLDSNLLASKLSFKEIQKLLEKFPSGPLARVVAPAVYREDGVDLMLSIFAYSALQTQQYFAKAIRDHALRVGMEHKISEEDMEKVLKKDLDISIRIILMNVFSKTHPNNQLLNEEIGKILAISPSLIFAYEKDLVGYIPSDSDAAFGVSVYRSLGGLIRGLDWESFNSDASPEEIYNLIFIIKKIYPHPKDFAAAINKIDISRLNGLSDEKKMKLMGVLTDKLIHSKADVEPIQKWSSYFKAEPEIFLEAANWRVAHMPITDLLEIVKSPVVSPERAKKLLTSSLAQVRWLSWIHYMNDPNTSKLVNIEALLKTFREVRSRISRAVLTENPAFKRNNFPILKALLISVQKLKTHLQKEQIAGSIAEIQLLGDEMVGDDAIEMEGLRLAAIRGLVPSNHFGRILEEMLDSRSRSVQSKVIVANTLKNFDVTMSQAYGAKVFASCLYANGMISRLYKAFAKKDGYNEKQSLDCLLENNGDKLDLLAALGFEDPRLSEALLNLYLRVYDDFEALPDRTVIRWLSGVGSSSVKLKEKLKERLLITISEVPILEFTLYIKLFSDDLEPVLESIWKHRRISEARFEMIKALVLEVSKDRSLLEKIKNAQDVRLKMGRRPIELSGQPLQVWIEEQLDKNIKSNKLSCSNILKE